MNIQATEVLISASVSMGVATSIDASPLITAYFKNKTKKLEDDTNKLNDKGDNNG